MTLRASFRQLLLLAFVLMALLLGAVSLSGLQALQGLLAQSREAGQQSVQLNLSTRGLAERSTDMERAARQYLVLGDDTVRQRFDDAANQAQALLLPLGQYPPTAALAQQWLASVVRVRSQLADGRLPRAARGEAVAAEFRTLDGISRGLTLQVQQSLAEHNQQVQDALETQRNRQVQQVLVAIVAAAMAALAFGLWLTQPLRRLGRAIVALGEGRLNEPVDIRGPSDLASLGRQLDWLRLRLTELDEDKARFLRHTSHELKTPLAALREGVALLGEGVGGTLGTEQAEIVGILQHNTGVLQQQIEDLLRYNAAAFDARQLQRRPTVLHSLVEEVVQAQRLSWQARGLTVVVEGDATLSHPVDPERLGMALGNLLSNAIRFSPVGGRIRWWVGLLGSTEDRYIALQINDDGPGIAAADRDHIFDPFYRGGTQPPPLRTPTGTPTRTDPPRGSGIGLAIVREQVAAHGGRVQLMADAGGACFRLLLPLDAPYA
ncbi:ATP-binding protein [Rhodoferax sp. WC2427]|uniref:HAMP domain-containing sensor histidine kinase n=1 Tax=Rhodoferax sp. WC2427 TaxID=3234144 RepID=UPI0034658E02